MNRNIILSLILLIAVGAALYVLFPESENGDVAFCTQDALGCPDGSYVGREGKECKFSACQASGPFEGTLMEEDGGFGLLLPSLDGNPNASYVLPLDIKVSNVLKQMVGKKVSVSGNFREANTFVVDSLEEIGGIVDGDSASVKVGETRIVNDLKVTLNSVVADYRCPKDVQCIQAGAITVNVTLDGAGKKETKNMASDEAPMPFGTFKVSIVDINPPLISTIPADPKAYVITFRVEK